MTVERAARREREVGCVVARDVGVLVVLTDSGTVRATYGVRMLGAIARDRSRVPEPGEWVELKPGRVLLVEGIGASEPAPEVVWDRVLWLAAPAAVRGKRALQRDRVDVWCAGVLRTRWR